MNMGIKIYNRDILIETTILFALFYLPSYMFQSSMGDPSAFNDALFNIQLWSAYLPQIALILFIIYKNSSKSFSDYGLKKITRNDLPSIVITALGLVILVGLLQLVLFLIPVEATAENPFVWDFHNTKVIPLLLISSLLTGYSEELFFRSYLYTQLEDLKLGKIHIIITVNLIFSLGHFYEGYAGGLNALILGSYFSIIFLWKRNIHIPAIVHGLYNFTALMISFYVQST